MNPNMVHQGRNMNPAGFAAYTFGSCLKMLARTPAAVNTQGPVGKPHTVSVCACVPVGIQRPGLGPLCIMILCLASLKSQPGARTAAGNPQRFSCLLFPGCAV